jgi:signal transduction histidine kinase
MLSIIYQTPMGLIEADIDGKIIQMNAKGIQLLMPLFVNNNLTGENINELLEIEAPEVLDSVKKFKNKSGSIINQFSQELNLNKNTDKPIIRYFTFSANKIDESSLMYFFDDITERHEKEKLLNEILREKAIEQSKFETASGVLHDIGNAITGFASYISKIKQAVAQLDIENLKKLKLFVEGNSPAFNNAIGERKTLAVIDLIGEIVQNHQTSNTHINELIGSQLNILSHIQEILSIQRQYVVGKSNVRELIDLRNILTDAKAMLFNTMENSHIDFQIDTPTHITKISGDRTKLIQVFLNLFKNAVDSILTSKNVLKSILVSIAATDKKITVTIKDSGDGFDADTKESLFNRGFTTKTSGSGLGLANCKSIIEGHNGDLTLESEGVGLGATITVYFNI